MMEMVIALTASFVAVLTDIRILVVAALFGFATPKAMVAILLGGIAGGAILYGSQLKMAPILGIPDPDFASLAQDVIFSAIVTSIFAGVRAMVSRSKTAVEDK